MKRIIILLALTYMQAALSDGISGARYNHTSTHCKKTGCSPTASIAPKEVPLYYPKYSNIKNHPGRFNNDNIDTIIVMGLIKDKNCVPIANAKIKIWQNDEYGTARYKNLNYVFSDKYKLNYEMYSEFVGVGSATTDNFGRFAFLTAIPNSHTKIHYKQAIHFTAEHPDFPAIHNQLLFNSRDKSLVDYVHANYNDEESQGYDIKTYDFELVMNGINKFRQY